MERSDLTLKRSQAAADERRKQRLAQMQAEAEAGGAPASVQSHASANAEPVTTEACCKLCARVRCTANRARGRGVYKGWEGESHKRSSHYAPPNSQTMGWKSGAGDSRSGNADGCAAASHALRKVVANALASEPEKAFRI